MNPHTLSDLGLQMLSRFETFVPVPYKDVAGNLTIGYGHLIKPGEHFAAIDNNQALKLLALDVNIAEHAVLHMVHAPLKQTQFDALVLFVFNVGTGAFSTSTMLGMLNRRLYAAAAQEFDRWIYSGGKPVLKRRRAAERRLFIGGFYGC